MEKKFFNWPIFFVLIFLNTLPTSAQHTPINASHIRQQAHGIATVSMIVKDAPTDYHNAIPCLTLGQEAELELSFDELEPLQTRTLFYSFEHCDAQWQPSDIMEIDYVEGFNKIYGAEKAENSLGTTTDYVHYTVSVTTAPLLISGNYVVKVFDDLNPDAPIVVRPFMVSEQTVGIDSRVDKTDTEHGMQQLSFTVRTAGIDITDPSREITVASWQNNRTDDIRIESEPSLMRQGELLYEGQMFGFGGGNEFRWVDNRDLKYVRGNTLSISFFDPFYHTTLYTDGELTEYSYHEDFNGGSYIETRNSPHSPTVAADYTLTHFSLYAPQGNDIYLYGALTGNVVSESCRMRYNEATSLYECTLRLKQGLHAYQYLTLDKASRSLTNTPTEGSFTQTENNYTIAVYYRSLSGLYDRLVAVKTHNTMHSRNAFVY